MTRTGFGDHLKREREMRGVSLDEICAATRISTRFLEALENEDWERLPGGVFNRGFVRAVARYLGLDEDGLVAEYAQAMNQQTAVLLPAEPDASQPSRSRAWLGVLALLVLAGLGWLGWQWYSGTRTAQSPSAPAPARPSSESFPEPAGPLGPPRLADSQSAGGLTLKIEAGKSTVISVIADERRIFDGALFAGQSRTFQAQEGFEVAAADAGALLLELNGHTLPPMGPPDSPGRVTLTHRDLSDAAGGPH